jgi:hypothetical protein
VAVVHTDGWFCLQAERTGERTSAELHHARSVLNEANMPGPRSPDVILTGSGREAVRGDVCAGPSCRGQLAGVVQSCPSFLRGEPLPKRGIFQADCHPCVRIAQLRFIAAIGLIEPRICQSTLKPV